jgi:hypothetical protein
MSAVHQVGGELQLRIALRAADPEPDRTPVRPVHDDLRVPRQHRSPVGRTVADASGRRIMLIGGEWGVWSERFRFSYPGRPVRPSGSGTGCGCGGDRAGVPTPVAPGAPGHPYTGRRVRCGRRYGRNRRCASRPRADRPAGPAGRLPRSPRSAPARALRHGTRPRFGRLRRGGGARGSARAPRCSCPRPGPCPTLPPAGWVDPGGTGARHASPAASARVNRAMGEPCDGRPGRGDGGEAARQRYSAPV